jgi:hypothetical protein
MRMQNGRVARRSVDGPLVDLPWSRLGRDDQIKRSPAPRGARSRASSGAGKIFAAGRIELAVGGEFAVAPAAVTNRSPR